MMCIVWLVLAVLEVIWLIRALQMKPEQFPNLSPEQFVRKRSLAIWSSVVFFIAFGIYILLNAGVIIAGITAGPTAAKMMFIISAVLFLGSLVFSAVLGSLSARMK